MSIEAKIIALRDELEELLDTHGLDPMFILRNTVQALTEIIES